jgi:hypothetical protein
LIVIFICSAVAAADSLPTDCDTARDRVKSKYGAVRHYFDMFNQCVTRANGDTSQCEAALNDQQAALGDFIFAQRVAQDVCAGLRHAGAEDSNSTVTSCLDGNQCD